MNTQEHLLSIVEDEGPVTPLFTKTRTLAAKYIAEKANEKPLTWGIFVADAMESFGPEAMEILGNVFQESWDMLRDKGETQADGNEYEARSGTWRNDMQDEHRKTQTEEPTEPSGSFLTELSGLAVDYIVVSTQEKAYSFASFIAMALEDFGPEVMEKIGDTFEMSWKLLRQMESKQEGDVEYDDPQGSWREQVATDDQTSTAANDIEGQSEAIPDAKQGTEGADISQSTLKHGPLKGADNGHEGSDWRKIADWLLELGFKAGDIPIAAVGMFVYSEGPFTVRCTLWGPGLGGDMLSADGTEITARTMGDIEFSLYFHLFDSKATLAAILHFFTRDWSDNYKREVTPKSIKSGIINEKDLPAELPWRALGRTNKDLLPWEKQWAEERRERERLAAIYAARPHCRVDRRHMRLGLNTLAETLPKLPEGAIAYVSFTSEIFSISFGDDCCEKPIKLIAEGRDWEQSYRVYAAGLEPVPKRLTGDNPAFGIWKSKFEIGRSRFPLIDKVDDPTEPYTE